MKFSFHIALRFLKSSKSQTLLILLGIAVGVSVQIFIGSLIQGLQKSLIHKTIGNASQVTVTAVDGDKKIPQYDRMIQLIKNSDSRIKQVAAVVDVPSLIVKDSSRYNVLVRGMKFSASDPIYNLKNRIYSGRTPTAQNETLLGKELANQLDVKLGDRISLITDSGRTNLKVVGFYDLNVATINKSWVITPIETAQSMLGSIGEATAIEIQVNQVFQADKVGTGLASLLGSKYKVDNWKAQNGELLSGLSGQSASSMMIQVFVLIAVALAIASVLAISVVQKSKQIGILKAMGLNDRNASLVFLSEGLLLGFIGAILGIILGLSLTLMFAKFALNPDGTSIVPFQADAGFVAFSALIALGCAAVASVIPAIHSSKLNPIEVIRNA